MQQIFIEKCLWSIKYQNKKLEIGSNISEVDL